MHPRGANIPALSAIMHGRMATLLQHLLHVPRLWFDGNSAESRPGSLMRRIQLAASILG